MPRGGARQGAGRPPECDCEPCRKKRESGRRWFEKNRERRLAENAARARNRRAEDRRRHPHLTEAEIDSKALEMLQREGFR